MPHLAIETMNKLFTLRTIAKRLSLVMTPSTKEPFKLWSGHVQLDLGSFEIEDCDSIDTLVSLLYDAHIGFPSGVSQTHRVPEPRRRAAVLMPTFKARYQALGGHTHIDCFVARQPNTTFAKMGTLVCDNKDLEDLLIAMSGFMLEIAKKPS